MSNADRYVSDKEAAKVTGLSRAWFQKHRSDGTGIPYIKMGEGQYARVRYKLGDVKAFMVRVGTKHEPVAAIKQPPALVIERGIPIPVKRYMHSGHSKVLAQLAVGDSVLLPVPRQTASSQAHSVLGIGRYVSRKEGESATRVWRTA